MLRMFFAALTAFFLIQTNPVQAQTNAEIESVIQGQIDAFLMDDMATAFTYAAPSIKRAFGSSERFGQMVKQGFPMVYRPANVQFLELSEQSGVAWQKVRVFDQKGIDHTLAYQLIPGAEGGWKISAVQILARTDVGV